MNPVRYPIGIQSFEKLREKNCVYVDKTALAYRLITEGDFIFLSRPRRFGKSLLISTIKALFEGRRDLFEGLAVCDTDFDWQKHPVLHIDFTGADYSEPDALDSGLGNTFQRWEHEYGCNAEGLSLGDRFGNIIRAAHEKTGQKVVILIDEYDKPLLETVNAPELQEKFRNQLRSVYGNLKKMDAHIHFAMLTGVTKFGHLSIFSDLNNLLDISMMPEYSGICGITTDELEKYFKEGISEFAEENAISIEDAFETLRDNYDGYHFSPQNSVDVYNPFSLLIALYNKEIGQYWYATGTPTFLIKMIKSKKIALRNLTEVTLTKSQIENVQFDMKSSLYPIMYQAGYLTIKDYIPATKGIRLGFPNKEVEEGFYEQLMVTYMPKTVDSTEFSITAFYEDLLYGRAEDFMRRLQSLFADFNYDSFSMLELEQHYQDVTYILCKLIGFTTHAEYRTASGRIDMVVEMPAYIYVIEFKMDRSAEEALAQIDDRSYLLPFKADGRTLIKIGANFSSRTRTLDTWIIE